jgi:hypothetical protein
MSLSPLPISWMKRLHQHSSPPPPPRRPLLVPGIFTNKTMNNVCLQTLSENVFNRRNGLAEDRKISQYFAIFRILVCGFSLLLDQISRHFAAYASAEVQK